jgi:hypothetical protein
MRSKKMKSRSLFLSFEKMAVCLLSKLPTIALSTFFLTMMRASGEKKLRAGEKNLRAPKVSLLVR